MVHVPQRKTEKATRDDSRRLRAHYDRLAPRYAKLYENQSRVSKSYTSRQEKVYKLLDGLHGGSALEVGCAAGLMVDFFLGRGTQYQGIDISPGMIKVCQERFQKADQATFSVGDARELKFPDCEFDVIVCLGVLEYIPDEQRAVKEMARVLKSSGTLILSGITKWSPYNVFDRLVYRKIKRWQPACIVREFHNEAEYCTLLSRAQLEVVDLAYFNYFPDIARLEELLPTWIARLGVDRLSSSWLRRLGRGFIVMARKPEVDHA